MNVYAFIMENPGHYLVGKSSADVEHVAANENVALGEVAHLMVTRGHCVFTPVDVLDTIHVRLDCYVGFGLLNDEYREAYEQWTHLRKNPPNFEVEEGE